MNKQAKDNDLESQWRIWIDRGGTFTDIIATDGKGSWHHDKLLSQNPEQYEDSAIEGIRRLLGVPSGTAITPDIASTRIHSVRMGTTVATNALLERKGAPTLLLVNAGLEDLVIIGDQARPNLFARAIVRPDPLTSDVHGVTARLDAQGVELIGLDDAEIKAILGAARARGCQAVAIALLHSLRNPVHEQRIAELARAYDFEWVAQSHEVAPVFRYIDRIETTLLEAYVSPILQHYIRRVRAQLPGVNLQFMQSNGGLAAAERFSGKNAILSGPAGGIAGAVLAADELGYDRVVSFDMGGTSTDVAHYGGEFARRVENRIAGMRVATPMLEIHTVAAGGGSICRMADGRFVVGPHSAGANPGPACYRRGGPLTVTDCNLVLGRILPNYFPPIFGVHADQPLDPAASWERIAAIIQENPNLPRHLREDPRAVAEGFIAVVNEQMAKAIKNISVQRGIDVRDHVLVSFGGAGSQHACEVADILGMERVLVHDYASVLSAYGIGNAVLREVQQIAVEVPLSAEGSPPVTTDAVRVLATLTTLEADASAAIEQQGAEVATLLRRGFVRYEGSETTVGMLFAPGTVRIAEGGAGFQALFASTYGYAPPADRRLILAAVEVEAVAHAVSNQSASSSAVGVAAPAESSAIRFQQQDIAVEILPRQQLAPKQVYDGGLLITDSTTFTVVPPGWQACKQANGTLLIVRNVPVFAPTDAQGTYATPDPVKLELFNNLFMSIAEQMGYQLQKTAISVNIKERLDFSCGLFDTDGALVANAPHMPVHLGSMGISVKAVKERYGNDMHPGDAFLVNAPWAGGTHLPDLTVVSPVFAASDDDNPDARLQFFVASRGHHADVGGITPGSMPGHSVHIDEEGVVFEPWRFIHRGTFDEAGLLDRLTSARHPARNPQQNMADILAQVSANSTGIHEIHRMIQRYSWRQVSAYLAHVQANAAAAVRKAMAKLRGGSFAYNLDNGSKVVVTIRVPGQDGYAGDKLEVDFTGTSPQQENNFNAPEAVSRAAVLYAFRSLVDTEIPMNEGCLLPIELIIPPNTMLSPCYPAAVVAGNVETSQVVTDAIYGALGLQAAAQGTMNNMTFGNAQTQYYETVCGGAGAGEGFNGCDAVHTHMTNSRLTDPEIFEMRFPVRLERFAIRHGSGGGGEYRGGHGVIRAVRFLDDVVLNLLSNRRTYPPFGMNGGESGALGRQWIVLPDGEELPFPACGTMEIKAQTCFVVETPGGGGWGTIDSS